MACHREAFVSSTAGRECYRPRQYSTSVSTDASPTDNRCSVLLLPRADDDGQDSSIGTCDHVPCLCKDSLSQNSAVTYQRRRHRCRRTISKSKNSSCRLSLTWMIVPFFSNIALSVGIVMLLFKYSDFLYQPSSAALGLQLCFPCNDIQDVDLEQFNYKNQDGRRMCCLKNLTRLPTFVQEFVNAEVQRNIQQQMNEATGPAVNPNRCAAHVALKPNHSNHASAQSRYKIVQGWSEEGDVTFIRSCIKLSKSKTEFTITKAGIYVVYSRIVFDSPHRPPTSRSSPEDLVVTQEIKDPVRFGQQVKEYKRPGALLEDSHEKNCSSPANSIPCYSSMLFSTLSLHRNSKIYVEARPLDLLSSNSYFGLYKID